MGIVDALCKHCGKAFRWLTGTPMYCSKCREERKEQW